jgi:glycosyltransferase involved in cell wall biosynthesis
LVPVKNHRLLLDAAHLVARSSQLAAQFWIIGDGELRDDLQRYATSLGLNGAVQFLGWRRDLPVVYRDLDIVVLTSRNEGSPVSLIEAMAAARPIVATDVGGVRELLTGDEERGMKKEDGGWRMEERDAARSSLLPPPSSSSHFEVLAHGLLVPPGSAEALAAALERLIVDAPLRQALGQAGRRFAASRYRLERLVADIERLYGELLRQSHKS